MSPWLKLSATFILCLSCMILPLSSQAFISTSTQDSTAERDAWLKQRFSEQHQRLIPVVAVADMFFSCNQQRKIDAVDYQLKDLIVEMDKDLLAEKLAECLAEDTMQSDVALNFGLLGCFHDQLAHLSQTEREQKMKLVKQAIAALTRSERKKSFTQCVTEQSIHYLK